MYADLVEAGIVDPTKVARLALENAVSVAGMLLLTETTMTEIPEEKDHSRASGYRAELGRTRRVSSPSYESRRVRRLDGMSVILMAVPQESTRER